MIMQTLLPIFAIDLNWGNITRPIYELFMGNETAGVTGVIGDEMLLGVFLLLIFMILTFMFGLGMLIGSPVIIASLFAVFKWIPNLRVVVAIIIGLLFGLALHRLIKR
jgi:hypothetical protein